MSFSTESGSTLDQIAKPLSDLNEDSVGELVDRFYARVREDDLIGPIFNGAVQSWPGHLSLLKDFWCSVLFGQGRYKGNPLLAHFRLPMEDRFFDRWLALFDETAAEILEPQAAAFIVGRATQIAANMRRVIGRY